MDETVRLILWLALAGTAVTFAGSAAIWFMDEDRRIRRAFRHVMKAQADAVINAHGRGVGFNFSRNLAAVAWDQGAWCLVYRIDELVGAELIIEGDVRARVYRGEARRPLEQRGSANGQVILRFIFDDARYPDFELVLWAPGDEARRNGPSPAQAIQDGNRWITRMEAILRRAAPVQRPSPAPPSQPQVPAVPTPEPQFEALQDEPSDPLDQSPPWDEAPVGKPARQAQREPRTRDLFDDEDEALS
mgnify:CR=1 FL=1